jgi:hypothetical protein
MHIVPWLLGAMSTMAAIQLLTAVSAFGFHLEPSFDPEPLFVVCQDQQYALCAAASCFVYNPTASFNSLSNVPVLKGVVTSRSWLTSDTLRWSWDPTSSVSSGAGTFGSETEV